MNNLKVRKSSLMLSVIILSLLVTPLLATKGETYQLVYSDFYIEASKPEVLAEMDFALNNLNDYVFGLPQASGVGTFTTLQMFDPSFSRAYEKSIVCDPYLTESTTVVSLSKT